MRRRMLASLAKSGGWVNPYVTDGLVFMADALFGDEFVDLSGNNTTANITGGAIVKSGDEFVCENATVAFPDIDLAPFNAKDFTVEVVIRSDAQDGATGAANLIGYNGTINVADLENTTLPLNRLFHIYVGYYYTQLPGTTTYASISMSYLPGLTPYIGRAAVNGVRKMSQVGYGEYPQVETFGFGIARPVNKRICCYRIYDHYIGEPNVAANAAIDIERFKLPQ